MQQEDLIYEKGLQFMFPYVLIVNIWTKLTNKTAKFEIWAGQKLDFFGFESVIQGLSGSRMTIELP